MKKIVTLFYALVLMLPQIVAQDKGTDLSITFGGFLKTDFFYDSHESLTLREGHIMLYPVKDKKDVLGTIYNDKAHFNILAIQSRLNAKISAPDFLQGKTSGFVEAEFFGTSDGDVNGVRMRHAYLKIDWTNFSILTGQYWHPFLVPEVFADVISFNTGLPIQPFARNPQIKLFYRFSGMELVSTFASQRDFTSQGPVEKGTALTANSSFLRNAGLPIIDLQLKYKAQNVVLGLGGNFKQLKPRTVTEKNYQTDEKLSSIAGSLFGKYENATFSFKAMAVYGENMYDVLSLGGYGVKTLDTLTGKETYSNIAAGSFWTDISYGADLKVGLFAGYTQNLGSKDDLIKGRIYSRAEDLHSVTRISPRVTYQMNKVKFGLEVEYTSANYGTVTSKGKVENYSAVNNLRILFGSFLFF